MKNLFVFKDNKKEYDFIIVIPSMNKEENNLRRKKIISLVESSLKNKLFVYNIYIAFEGQDWNEAINISFDRLKNKIKTGLILLDDDSFPFQDWMDNFEFYLKRYSSEMMQFSLINSIGSIQGGNKFIKINNFQKSLIQLFNHQFISGNYWTYNFYKKKYDKKLKQPILISSACFSAVYVSKKIINSLKGVHKRSEDKRIRYYEDGDFSYRAINEGYKIYNIPGRVFHLGGKTKSISPQILLDSEYSRLWMFRWFTDVNFLKRINDLKLVKKFNFSFILLNEFKSKISILLNRKTFFNYLKKNKIYP